MVTWKELGMGKVAVAAMLCLLLPAAVLAATITNGHEARRSGKVHENASTERHMAAQRQSRTTAHAGAAHSAGRHATAGAKAAGNGKSAADLPRQQVGHFSVARHGLCLSRCRIGP